jgi:hypothetical protein
MLTEQHVRTLLLEVLGAQTCQVTPHEWPQVLGRLMKATADRYSLKDAVDEAVLALLAAFRDGSPADPTATVWRCFPNSTRTAAPRSPSG